MNKSCEKCESSFVVPPSRSSKRFCSKKCAEDAKRKPCPFSLERLRELYWKEGKSLHDIAFDAGASANTVTRWLNDAGITIRSASEAHKLNWHGAAGRRKKQSEVASTVNANRVYEDTPLPRLQKMWKNSAKSNKLVRLSKPCCRPSCNSIVTDIQSRFDQGFFYCCKACCFGDAKRRAKINASRKIEVADARYL